MANFPEREREREVLVLDFFGIFLQFPLRCIHYSGDTRASFEKDEICGGREKDFAFYLFIFSHVFFEISSWDVKMYV